MAAGWGRWPLLSCCWRNAETAGACLCTQVSIPLWALVHLPVMVTITTAMFTPKGWMHCILYVLFENAMGIVKLGAVIAGAHPPPVLPSTSLVSLVIAPLRIAQCSLCPAEGVV